MKAYLKCNYHRLPEPCNYLGNPSLKTPQSTHIFDASTGLSGWLPFSHTRAHPFSSQTRITILLQQTSKSALKQPHFMISSCGNIRMYSSTTRLPPEHTAHYDLPAQRYLSPNQPKHSFSSLLFLRREKMG